MTGIDTNILVRFFTKDDLEQGSRVADFMRDLRPESPGFVSLVSLIESVWVLRSKYRLSKAELVPCLEQLLNSRELVVENDTAVASALRRFSRFTWTSGVGSVTGPLPPPSVSAPPGTSATVIVKAER